MRKSFKKLMALGLSVTTMFSMLTACGSSPNENNTTTNATTTEKQAEATTVSEGGETTTASNTSDKPFEGVTLKYATTQTASTGEENLKLIELVKEKTGINIEFTIVPNSKSGELDKTLVSLMAGDEVDIIYNTRPGLKPFYNAGVLTPLSDLAKSANYDMEGKFGSYLPTFDGDVYGLPAFSDIWITLYNKKIFDDAGVAYPSSDGWTWEKYIETAKALTDTSKGIYGSLMLDYDCYNCATRF